MKEQEIIEALIRRDEGGAAAFLQAYTPLLRYVIGGVLRHPQDTEDCLSEVSLALWQKLERYDPDRGTLPVWLTAVARNAALNALQTRLRRERNLPETPPDPPTPEQEVLRRERTEQLRETVSRLSEADRQLFYRRYYYLQPVRQIAAELGMTERSVEGRLYRLRQKLRQELGGDGDA